MTVRVGRSVGVAVLLGGVLLFASPGCSDEGIGDPCVPEQEYDQSFLGFDEKEVSVESKSFQCRTRLCLVNHFRGRVSCPYGQDASGNGPPNGGNCKVPGTADAINGLIEQGKPDSFRDPRKKALVAAQCVDRTADRAVYCSCRCADINGGKPSDQIFCECPDGFRCERLVKSIGAGNEGLTGSYCIKDKSKFDPGDVCNKGDCDPNNKATKCQ